MTEFTPTPEQQAIVDAVRTTEVNIIVKALAGAAKTSTLVLMAHAQPKISILCLAFNKKIAVEMESRLPPNCVARTLNSLGHRVWGEFLGKRLNLQTSKTYGIVKRLIDDIKNADEKSEAYGVMSEIIRAVDVGKACGYVPTGHFPQAKGLMDDDEFFNWLDDEPTDLMWDIIRQASVDSMRESLRGTIDFGDQILMPTVFPCSFPQYPLVMVDEAQDLSTLNHAMLRKLLKAKNRLIAVGDECQSIYGFRGAHEDSMNLLEQEFHCKAFTLSISFRCPQSVVQVARKRAPHMQWPEWAKQGEVRRWDKWETAMLPDDAVILCRNNAPLFNMAIRLLTEGRYPELVGNDIGKGLLKTLNSFGPKDTPMNIVLDELQRWTSAKVKKSRNPDKVYDHAACLEIFIRKGETLGDAIAYAEYVMNASGPIRMMTGHKSKGLEFHNVFLLDMDLLRTKELQQERNLEYVMETRAQETMTYIKSDGFEPAELED